MGDPYGGLPDLRQLLARTTHFPDPPPEPFFLHRNLIPPPPPQQPPLHHDHGMVGHDDQFMTSAHHHHNGGVTAAELMYGWHNGNYNINEGLIMSNSSRWPRQETLTLLEIRTRLDSKFKEANQKGSLWNELARIMAEEYGYQRSGKKCREKFENLYKYYKKTKDGKSDGKHYRFFQQLEALYNGQTSNTTTTTNNNNNFHEQTLTSFSNSEFVTSASSGNNPIDHDISTIAFGINQKQKNVDVPKKNNSKEIKIKELVDSRMRKLIETQEIWMEKTLKNIEDREQERIFRGEQEIARLDREREFSSRERANWYQSRNTIFMESLRKFVGAKKESSSSINATTSEQNQMARWNDPEISSLIQIKNGMEPKMEEENESFWEEVGLKMASLGYERSGNECKEKWESMKLYFNMATECYKKSKQELRTSTYDYF